MTKNLDIHSCHVCGCNRLRHIDGFEQLPRITSDCKPFRAAGELVVCEDCGAVQKLVNEKWLSEISEIYAQYQAYELADGEEQLVFDQLTGAPRKRSEVIGERLCALDVLPEEAVALDIGCGDGVTLMALSNFFPAWKLNGHELSSSKEEKLKTIPGFNDLFTGDLQNLPTGFDFVSMMHSLEHFVSPLETLRVLHSKLNASGILFVEVCNVDENPFDLLVADHLMHFSPDVLGNLVELAGFTVIRCETDWVKKEISLLAQKSENHKKSPRMAYGNQYGQITGYVEWLCDISVSANEVAKSGKSFGVFGTSIAASWLAVQLGPEIGFFVDEDPNRIGRNYLGKPVFHPSDVPADALIYIALAPALAEKIKPRLNAYAWEKCYPSLPNHT